MKKTETPPSTLFLFISLFLLLAATFLTWECNQDKKQRENKEQQKAPKKSVLFYFYPK